MGSEFGEQPSPGELADFTVTPDDVLELFNTTQNRLARADRGAFWGKALRGGLPRDYILVDRTETGFEYTTGQRSHGEREPLAEHFRLGGNLELTQIEEIPEPNGDTTEVAFGATHDDARRLIRRIRTGNLNFQ